MFTKQQILWECLSYEACETYPEGLPPSYHGDCSEMMDLRIPLPVYVLKREIARFGRSSNKYLSSHLQHIKSRSYSRGVSNVDEFWYVCKYIVEDFCSRELTVSDDRLVALAGIATSLSQSTGYRYLVGIWDRKFDYSVTLMELLWSSSSGYFCPRPSRYRAPSWSWASVDCGISTSVIRMSLISTCRLIGLSR